MLTDGGEAEAVALAHLVGGEAALFHGCLVGMVDMKLKFTISSKENFTREKLKTGFYIHHPHRRGFPRLAEASSMHMETPLGIGCGVAAKKAWHT